MFIEKRTSTFEFIVYDNDLLPSSQVMALFNFKPPLLKQTDTSKRHLLMNANHNFSGVSQ